MGGNSRKISLKYCFYLFNLFSRFRTPVTHALYIFNTFHVSLMFIFCPFSLLVPQAEYSLLTFLQFTNLLSAVSNMLFHPSVEFLVSFAVLIF